jgi:dienelactone hydrolase
MTARPSPARIVRSPCLALGLARGLALGLALACAWLSGASWAGENRSPDLTAMEAFTDDPVQLAKTWDNGFVFVPGAVIGGYTYGRMNMPKVAARLAALPADVRYPLIVFLHDAGGVTGAVNRLLKSLESENFAVVLPDSYARDGRRTDCEGKPWNPENCAMAPDIYLARRAELLYAVEAARHLPWVDQQNVFLAGSGEGAIAVALWGGEVEVSGYVVANWTCTAPAELAWAAGLRVPSDRPTLALATRGHRWSGRPGWDGRCADQAAADAALTSVTIDSGLRNVFQLPEARRALIEFLYANLRIRPK